MAEGYKDMPIKASMVIGGYRDIPIRARFNAFDKYQLTVGQENRLDEIATRLHELETEILQAEAALTQARKDLKDTQECMEAVWSPHEAGGSDMTRAELKTIVDTYYDDGEGNIDYTAAMMKDKGPWVTLKGSLMLLQGEKSDLLEEQRSMLYSIL